MTEYQTGLIWGGILGWLISSFTLVFWLALFRGGNAAECMPDWRGENETQRLSEAEKDSGVEQCLAVNNNGGLKMGVDNVNHPAHYKLPGGGETIDFIDAACGEGAEYYYQGNILKYVCRYREKGGAESLKKARWYLDRLIGMQEIKEMGLRDD